MAWQGTTLFTSHVQEISAQGLRQELRAAKKRATGPVTNSESVGVYLLYQLACHRMEEHATLSYTYWLP